MTIIIVGGGITGLTVAYELSKKGQDVILIEKDRVLGGLASCFKINGVWLDKYYHHIFTRDTHMLALLEELNFSEEIIWKKTKMGFYCDDVVHPFGTPIDLLKFPSLRMRDKFRFGIIILLMKITNNWKKLDKISAKEWLIHKGGLNLYEKIWEPLLKVKFGSKLERASAGWLWGRIKPRANSRSKDMSSEVLGYLNGGFQVFIDALADKVKENGGKIFTDKCVDEIIIENNRVKGIVCGGKVLKAENVVFTTAIPELLNMCKLPDSLTKQLKSIDYQAVICVVLGMKKTLSDKYWLNIGDSSLNFGGVIEHTNFIPKETYGHNIIYLFNYVEHDNKLWLMDNEDIIETFKSDLKKVYSDFDYSDVNFSVVFREPYATPVYDIGFSEKMPDYTIGINGIYLAGTTHVYPLDRNMDGAVAVGQRVALEIIHTSGGGIQL